MFTDEVFAAADAWDGQVGLSAVEDERRLELMKVVRFLAEADHTVDEVRKGMLGPYGGLLRLKVCTYRAARAVARVTALNEEVRSRVREVGQRPGGQPVAAVLESRLRLHLEVEAELAATLSPERRAVIDGLKLAG